MDRESERLLTENRYSPFVPIAEIHVYPTNAW